MNRAGNRRDHDHSASKLFSGTKNISGVAAHNAVAQNKIVQAVHSIQVASRRTGLSADVIRAWERRYAAVLPRRSQTSRRFYSDSDIQRLLLLHQATMGGRRIGDIASLNTGELEALVNADRETSLSPNISSIGTRGTDTSEKRETESALWNGAQKTGAADYSQTEAASVASKYLDACLDAVKRLDSLALEHALSTATVGLSVPVLLESVIFELMGIIGAQWRRGSMRLCHEHLATAVVRSFLGSMISTSHMAAGSGPVAIVTTPAGQRHELGSLMVAVIAAARGWDPLYLGANMPSEEIAFAARTRDASAIALSICYPADDPTLHPQLRKLRQQVPASIPILVGGNAVAGYSQALDDIKAICPSGLGSLALALDDLRS